MKPLEVIASVLYFSGVLNITIGTFMDDTNGSSFKIVVLGVFSVVIGLAAYGLSR